MPRSRGKTAATCTATGSGLELLVDQIREPQQFVLAEIGGRERVADFAVDPVEHADVVFARVAEGGLAVARGLGAHVERQAPAVLRLVHELRDRSIVAGQEASADERHAGLFELRGAQLYANAFRQPGDEML